LIALIVCRCSFPGQRRRIITAEYQNPHLRADAQIPPLKAAAQLKSVRAQLFIASAFRASAAARTPTVRVFELQIIL
jgi:hypothetical protein